MEIPMNLSPEIEDLAKDAMRANPMPFEEEYGHTKQLCLWNLFQKEETEDKEEKCIEQNHT